MLIRQKTTVLLIDDHPIVRLGFAALLEQLGHDLTIIEADNAVDAITLSAEHMPDVALVDLSIADGMSFNLMQKIRSTSPKTHMLVVSMHDEMTHAERAINAGARGYVMKQQAAKLIIKAVQAILNGETFLSEDVRKKLFEPPIDYVVRGDQLSGVKSLTGREIDIFRLMGNGLTTADISKQLQISSSTVETHRANIRKKVGAESGSELYRLAYSHFQI